MKIKTPVQYLCWILTTLMPLFLGHIYAQTLDEVLGAGKTDYKQAKPETIEKWENILTMLDASRFEAALPELQKYRTIDDVTEPYQKVFWGWHSGYFKDLNPRLIAVVFNFFWQLDEKNLILPN